MDVDVVRQRPSHSVDLSKVEQDGQHHRCNCRGTAAEGRVSGAGPSPQDFLQRVKGDRDCPRLHVNALCVACGKGSSAYGKPETARFPTGRAFRPFDLDLRDPTPSRGRSHFGSQPTELDVVELVLLEQLDGQEQETIDDVSDSATDGMSARSGAEK